MNKGLNVRQEAFCWHYAKTGNATESYKQAGYTPKNDNAAAASASQLLNNPKVKARLQQITEELNSAKIASVREVQERLTSILRGELLEERVVVEGEGMGESRARIIKCAPQHKDVIKAGELLAKMQGGLDTGSTVNVVVPVFGGEDSLED